MHSARHCLLLAVGLAFTADSTYAQNPPPMGNKAVGTPGQQGLPLPEGDTMMVNVNTTERYSVAPYKLFGLPRSTREEIARIEIVKPAREGSLPDAVTITTTELVGATSIVLPLVKEGGVPFERRIELLVIDQISMAYKSFLETTIKRTYPRSSIEVVVANGQTAVLNGYVEQADQVQPIVDMVRAFLAARNNTAPEAVTVVNSIRVPGVQQVQLQCVIAEVQRSRIRELGFDFAWQDLSAPLTASLSNSLGARNTANMPFVVSRGGVFQFNGFLRAIVNNNLGKILAQPTIVAMSGQPAFFNSGGVTPVLIPQGNSTISIEYRPFGTNVRCVPTVLGDGRIRLQVRPEVSERNDALSVALPGGGNVPGFTTRVAETTVELEAGQTFAIAGLIQQRVNATTTKLPVVGDIPLVGWAFQTKQYTHADTELLILVTPHLVQPLDERPCKLPGRESRIPNDVEFFLGSKFEPPCFPDPYRDHYRKHFQGEKPPAAEPVPMYDTTIRPMYNASAPQTVAPTTPAPRQAPVAPAPVPVSRTNYVPEPATQSDLTPNVPNAPTTDSEQVEPVETAETTSVVPPPPPVGAEDAPMKIDADGWKSNK